MAELLKPAAGWELSSMLENLTQRAMPVEILGNGSKRSVGRPMQTGAMISTTSMRGISLYEPNELVMSVRAGTGLAQVEAELAGRRQMLAFEPIDLAPATGAASGRQSIGAVFAGNLSGSRRILAGAARDHVLGIKAVNGRGEQFQSGGRVMKNVTGIDLSRGLTGSWGTLAVLTEVTFKVLPWPEDAATIVFFGLPDDVAIELLCAAMGTPYEVSGTVHLPKVMARRLEDRELSQAGDAVTALRLESFSSFLPYRIERLLGVLRAYGEATILDYARTQHFWGELRRLSVLPYGPSLLWRITTAPSAGHRLVAAIRRNMPAEAFYDWSGGLVWLEVPESADAGAADIRRVVAAHGGHATLVRADQSVRAVVEVFPPRTPPIARLARGLKAAFDPAGILNPGRMYDDL